MLQSPKDINEIFKIIKLCHDFSKIKRQVYYKFEDRYENDIEHSYQLALVAWYVNQKHQLNLNMEKVIQYALVHDLIEIFAGDTDTFGSKQKNLNSKASRERAAKKKLQGKYSEFTELHETIETYEQNQEPETQLVHGLDKLLPLLNTYLGNDDYYCKNGVTLEAYLERQMPKMGNLEINKKLLFEAANFLSTVPNFFAT